MKIKSTAESLFEGSPKCKHLPSRNRCGQLARGEMARFTRERVLAAVGDEPERLAELTRG
jgi:hypothetical protein